MATTRVLLAGESWVSSSTHFKGWDFFSSTVYETGIHYLQQVMADAAIDFTFLPGHLAATEFPTSQDELDQFDVLILSDLGANTLLLHPDTWLRGKSVPNRLKLINTWVKDGGALMMCGGYYSFAGIYGAAKYYRTPIEEVLPVNIYTFDDRLETPEGATVEIIQPEHPIVRNIPAPWPALLGFNELTLKADADLIATVNGHPLLAVREVGKGKTMAWASDIGPHWCPEPFATWEGYGRLWQQSIAWLSQHD
ncbi:MAG: cytoplasmic protein [Caldilineaceae bacterium]|nr:cytoplasmic protein [Caldilineaceae bacterium]